MMRMLKLGVAMLLPMLLAACASLGPKVAALEQAQYDYSAAIRWGDFEGAWQMVEPEYRQKHPMSDVEFERYKQIQISSYRDLASQASEDKAIREIQINIINKHNMTERGMRYTELWRYDAEGKHWWVTNGLPDLWQGE
jgi:hypothetical protein